MSMRKALGYILSPLHYIAFGLLLLVFHPLQWLSLKLGGYKAHKKTVDIFNLCLLTTYYLLGNSVSFTQRFDLPTGRPILFISNHQSMYDIPPLIFFLRRYHAKFISKIELTKGIPSISFNLKYGGGANIDRKDSKQAIAEILKLAQRMKANNWSAVIFPEGTRAKTGELKPFSAGGIASIIKKVPNVLIVPIAINNSWKMVRYGTYPLNTFINMSWTVLKPIEPQGLAIDELIKETEKAIHDHIQSLKPTQA